ncbi:sce7726 family protein [Cellulomonas sp. NPDC058312]|uniref:sce7726 family protein n=1 Tax=Cellulomonas sp. NPDC058312 TaxID=3346441 RepID=UPI0036EE9B74
MRDKEMRHAVAERIRATHGGVDHLLIDEVDVRDTGRRMDLLLVAKELTAFELKSDGDSLRRLRPQAEAYGLVADRAVLVVGTRHVGAVDAHIPDWWAIWQVVGTSSGVRVKVLRRGSRNPVVDRRALAGLLLREELVEELSWYGRRGLSSLGVGGLRDEVVEAVPARELGPDIREHLMRRPAWRDRALSRYRQPYVPAAAEQELVLAAG